MIPTSLCKLLRKGTNKKLPYSNYCNRAFTFGPHLGGIPLERSPMGFPTSPLGSPAMVVDSCCYWYPNFATCLARMSSLRIINKQQYNMDNGKK